MVRNDACRRSKVGVFQYTYRNPPSIGYMFIIRFVSFFYNIVRFAKNVRLRILFSKFKFDKFLLTVVRTLTFRFLPFLYLATYLNVYDF